MSGLNDSRSSWATEKYRDRLHGDLRDGAVAGISGGVSIMVLALLYDILFLRPLATLDSLSLALIGQENFAAGAAAQMRVLQRGIFTVIHLAVFVLLGFLLVKFFRITGLRKTLLVGGLYGLTICTSLFGVSLQHFCPNPFPRSITERGEN